MNKTGTSNEVSTRRKKEEKDLLSKYQYEVSTCSLIFQPGRTKIKSTVNEMVGLPGTEYVVVKLENGKRNKDSFDQIPVKKSTAKKVSKKSSSSSKAEER